MAGSIGCFAFSGDLVVVFTGSGILWFSLDLLRSFLLRKGDVKWDLNKFKIDDWLCDFKSVASLAVCGRVETAGLTGWGIFVWCPLVLLSIRAELQIVSDFT